MSKIKLRRYRTSDQDTVLRLHVEGLKQTESFLDDPKYNQDFSNIKEIYLNNRGEFLMAMLNDEIIGMGALRKINEQTAEIKRMRVDLKYQRQGIGSTILDRLIDRARELGYEKIILDTNTNQAAARRLYEKYGFKEYKRGSVAHLQTIYYELIFLI
ncbi:MAG: GNAT family N-acetyltransferase [Patescibacteria group bacterium]|nr:GNAT family N-acetyltransferase [Patescibacteria group bacterium]